MTGLDLLIVGLVLVLTLRGIWRGFINDLSGLLGLVLGYFFAGPLAKYLDPFLEAFVEGPRLREGIAYYLSLFVIYLAVVFLGKLATGLSKLVLLGWLNRLLGALSGFTKGILIASLVALPLRWIGNEFPSVGPGEELRNKSRYFGYSLKLGTYLNSSLFRIEDGLNTGEDAPF
jgi:uncharacterized membrane protein required for colicin V production